MAITKMEQFTLLAFHEHQAALLKALQQFGDTHFRDLQKEDLSEYDFLVRDASPKRVTWLESQLDTVKIAIHKLSPYAPKRPITAKRPVLTYDEFDRYLDSYDYKAVCEKVRNVDDRLTAIRSETSKLKSENDQLRQWVRLDVSPSELEGFYAVRSLIGIINKTQADHFSQSVSDRFDCVYVEFLGTIKEDMTLLLFIPMEQYDEVFSFIKDNGFAKTNISFDEMPSRLMTENSARMDQIELERFQKIEEIREMSDEHEKLLIVQDYLQTVLAREKACENFMRTDLVTLIEGWYPKEEEPQFLSAIERICAGDFYLEHAEVEQDSTTVPIKLKNNAFVSAFEGITSMYSMPLYSEFDPTPIFAPFYWLFFGLMVGDIGYGILLLAATFVMLRFFDLKDGMKSMIRMFSYCSISTILTGILYGSCFGFAVFTPMIGPNGSPKAILDSQVDITTMLVLSIAIGVIHIIFGLGVKAATCLKNGDPLGALFDGGFWIITLISGIGLLISATGMIASSLSSVFGWIFALSLVGLAATQGRDSPTIGGKIGNGLYGVYGLSGYVGDIVSYTRIVALALSGAYIGFSFNLMTELIPGGIGWIARILILAAGHALNIGLALLGAYVHTCRLQYVEFFGKFYDGGGVPFRPLNLKNDYIHINK